MALNVFELFGKIVVDHSGAEKGIDKTVKHAKDAESNLSKTFKKVGTMVAAAFSVRAVVDFGKQCTQAYASIAAEESAFAQIMGDYADTAQAKLNAVADQTGVVSTRMTGAMTSLTAKFKGLGYDVEDATTLAADGLLIATDAAAFWDMSLDESMSHLNSFINGSYEGGEAIGLFANDTQMAAYAIEQGIVKDTKAWAALDEATRQATRLDYAKQMMESSGATGQAAKEADAYANVMANLKEHWRQFQGIIGKPILEKLVLPAMKKLNEFMPKLTEGVQNGIVLLEEGFGKIKGYFEEVFTEDGIKWDALPDAMSKTFKGIERKVGGWLSGVGQKVQNSWQTTVLPAIQNLASTFGIELPDVDLGSIFASFNTAYEEVKTTASKFYTDVKDAFAKDEDGKIHLDTALSGLFNAGVEARAGLLTAAGTLVADIYGKITGDTENAETIKTTLSGLFESGTNATSALITAAGGLLGEIYEGITGEEATAESIMSKVKGLFSVGSEALLGLTTDATGLMNNLAAVIGDDTMGAGAKVAAIFNEGANALSALLTRSGTLLSDLYYEITSDQKGAVQLATFFSELFAPPETWKSRMEKAGELFTAETFYNFVDEKASEQFAQYYRNMIGSMLAGGTIGETQYDAWLNALNQGMNGKDWSAATKAIEKLYWGKDNTLPWEQREGIYNGRYVDNDAKKGEHGYYEWEAMYEFLLNSPKPRKYLDDSEGTGGSNIIQNLITAINAQQAEIQGMYDNVTAAIADGFSGMSVTGYVTTGDVKLNEGTIVGTLAPKLNLELGWIGNRRR